MYNTKFCRPKILTLNPGQAVVAEAHTETLSNYYRECQCNVNKSFTFRNLFRNFSFLICSGNNKLDTQILSLGKICLIPE